jgi:hypothetical protein
MNIPRISDISAIRTKKPNANNKKEQTIPAHDLVDLIYETMS